MRKKRDFCGGRGLRWGLALGLGLLMPLAAAVAAQEASGGGGQGQGAATGRRGGMRSLGEFPGGGRGVVGTVTETAGDHYTIKGEDGAVYTVYYSVNTRIVKGGPGRRGRGEAGQGGAGQENPGQEGNGEGRGRRRGGEDGERPAPQLLKASDIKVGDVITAAGEMDEAGKSIGAVFIVQLDAERVKEMRAMQANYGKTWLAGKVTGVEGTTITIEGLMDHAKHTIEVDENTSFRRRRESVTLADIQPGMQLRAEGALQGGGFRATTVMAVEPRGDRGPGGPAGAGKQPPGV